MRGIAYEDDASVNVTLERHRMRLVEAMPHERVVRRLADIREMRVDARAGRSPHAFRRFRLPRRATEIVDAPYVFGLAMHEQRGTRIRWWIEPGAPFRRRLARDRDIGDHVSSFVRRSVHPQSERTACEAARPIARGEPRRLEVVRALGRIDPQGDAAFVRFDANGRRVPAKVDLRHARRRIDQMLFGEALLQVQHGRKLLLGVVRHFETQNLRASPIATSGNPRQSLSNDRIDDPETIPYLERPSRKADRATAEADAVTSLDNDGPDASTGQCESER